MGLPLHSDHIVCFTFVSPPDLHSNFGRAAPVAGDRVRTVGEELFSRSKFRP
jgi:hypothetical protein